MKKTHKEKVSLMSKHLSKIATHTSYYVQAIPEKKINNAIKTFAPGVDKSTIIGFYDTTVFESGKRGYIFTDEKLYFSDIFEKPQKIWYDDIKSMSITHIKGKDSECYLKINLYDGTQITVSDLSVNKPALRDFLEEMKGYEVSENAEPQNVEYKNTEPGVGAVAGGLGVGAYQTVNRVYDEEKFHARQGHGFAAEQANTLFDKMTGHDAKTVGDDNVKNGADRIVDGVYIQSKYCKTGSRCVNECFENGGKGSFRYMLDGKPMQIEVPSDKYDDAVRAMEEKIRRGQVSGVTDPEEAKNIIRKGHFKYAQAKNIAKSGTVESLAYDSVNGVITATSAFGVTAMITFATSVWDGEDFDVAIKLATYSGLKVGGTAFITSVLASQLAKAGLNSALVGSSEAIVSFIGPKASAVLINAFRSGSPIHGAAAMKSAAKLLRGNTITAAVTFVVLSSFDVANIFRGRISAKQLFKNMTGTAAAVGLGTGGWIAGAAAGSFLPGIGNVVGGIVGSVVGGAVGAKASNKVMGKFIEDDAEEMVKIIQDVFTELASDYLLNKKEAEKATDKLKDKLDGKTLKEMYASADRKKFAELLLRPIIENETAKRKFIHTPSAEQMVIGAKTLLEEIGDSEEWKKTLS